MTENKQQVMMVGSLTLTASLLITRLLGLIYVILISRMYGPSAVSYFSVGDSLVNAMMQVLGSGVSFGAAAIMTKYLSRKDYKTVRYIRKYSILIVLGCVFAVSLVLLLGSRPAALFMLGESAFDEDYSAIRSILMISALSLFVMAVAGIFRSFFQGIDDMKTDTWGQWIESGARAVLISAVIVLLHGMSVQADKAAVIASAMTAVASGLAVGYYLLKDREPSNTYAAAAKAQIIPRTSPAKVRKEMFDFCLPCLIYSIIIAVITMINPVFMIRVAQSAGFEYELARDLLGVVQLNTEYVTGLPVVFALLLSLGSVMTIAEGGMRRKNSMISAGIDSCFGRFMYVALPVNFTIACLAPQFWNLFFGETLLYRGSFALVYGAINGILAACVMIIHWIMISLQFSKEGILYALIGLVVKCVSFWFLMKNFGFEGAIVSSSLAYAVIMFLCLVKIRNKYEVSYSRFFIRFFKMIVACLCMNGAYALIRFAGLNAMTDSALLNLGEILLLCVCGTVVYMFVTNMMSVPKGVFKRGFRGLKRKKKA